MTKYERFVLWLNRFYHKQNKITICVLYTLIMAILGVLIYGATHQQANSNISVKYTRPTYTVTFDPNGGELSTIGGGVSSKLVRLGDTYGDLPIPTKAGYSFVGWKFNDEYITSTTQNITTVEHTLTAIWGHDLKVDYNNGSLSNSLSPTYAGEVGSTTSVPNVTPTYSGHTFAGWHYGKNLIEPTTFTGSNYIALGRDYMFTDKFTVVVRAFMDDWTELSTKLYRFVGCAQAAGWALHGTTSNKIRFAIYDSDVSNYACADSNISLSNLVSGYHTIIGTFDGSYARLYIDGVLTGTCTYNSSSIIYHSENGIFIGAESDEDATTPSNDYEFFKGTIDYVSIENSVATGTGAYTYPETYGNNLITPTTFSGSNFLTLGRQYMYTDKLTVTIRASMNNWADFGAVNNTMRLISCTDSGGWNIEPNNVDDSTVAGSYIRFAVYDSGIGYKHAICSVPLTQISSGYHTFTLTFDGHYARIYIDGMLTGTSAEFSSGKIAYNANNCIFVGAEAGSNTTTPESGRNFKGKIDYVSIVNDVRPSTSDYIYQDFDVVATAMWNKIS